MVKTSSCSDMQRSLRWDEDPEDAKTTASYGSKKQVCLAGQRGRSGGKSIKEKWSGGSEKVDPRQKSFTPQEEDLVIQLHSAIGSRWPIIAQQLPGRTDNDVKILWNSKLRKKLSAMGIDPVTHRPFSQILADYGNIGAFPKARTRFTSLSKDLKNAAAVIFKPEHQSHHQKSPQAFLANHDPIDLYSQLQAVNFITEASNYPEIESLNTGESPAMNNQEMSSFSWSDFFLEDAFSGQGGDVGQFGQCEDGEIEGKGKLGEAEDTKKHDGGGFEGSSSSTSYSFVDAMLEGQDATMFTQFPCFSEEPFYY